MSDPSLDRFKAELFRSLDETFDQVHGIFLDKGTSLFETLAAVPAADASSSLTPHSATIAAQVEHIRFYLDVVNEAIVNERFAKSDWKEIWQTVREVSPEQWDASRQRLRNSYDCVVATMKALKMDEKWQGDFGIPCALGILAHTAYHLGGLRATLAGIGN